MIFQKRKTQTFLGAGILSAVTLYGLTSCMDSPSSKNSNNNNTSITAEATCDSVDQVDTGAIYRMPVGGNQAPTKLLSNLALPWDISVDNNLLYFSDDGTGGCTGSIKTVAADAPPGTAPKVIVSGLDRPNPQVIYNGHVFFTQYKDSGAGAVYRADINTGEKELLVEGLNRPFALTVESQGSETWVYFTEDGSSANNYADGTVKRFHIGGDGSVAENVTLADQLRRPLGLVMDADYLYVVEMDGGRVFRMGKNLAGGSMPLQQNLMTGLSSPYPPKLVNGVLFFAEFNPADYTAGKVYMLSGVNSPGSITAITPSNCGPSSPLSCTLLAQSLSWPMAVALDNVNVYWTEIYSPSIKSVKKDGSSAAPTVLADGTQYGFKTSPWMDTDGVNVYFVDLGNTPCCFSRF